jgi:hypothetical protein
MNNNNQLTWERFLQALTDEEAAFNFPIKYPALDFDKSTKNTILIATGILAFGIIAGAYIRKNK